MTAPRPAVDAIAASDVPDVVALFCAAFRDYPVMRFVIGADDDAYDERLARLVHFFVMARALRGEPMFGVRYDGALCAAATTSDPARAGAPSALTFVREDCWRALGAGARGRYERCGAVWRRLGVGFPRVHLNMIGVHPQWQGSGYGGLLLGRVHELSRATPGSQGVSLTTEAPANVPLYARAGYRVVGRATIAPGLETWSFFRADAPPA